MSNSSSNITELNIKELLDGSDSYMIPIYQRNYAWEEKEIEQLIQDILDYIPSASYDESKDYFIGTLIINKQDVNNKIIYETIDGQQRLTTLSLLTSVIKHKQGLDWYQGINLSFQSRLKSTETLFDIFQENIHNHNKTYNDNIINGHNLILKHLDKKLVEAEVTLKTFSDFLFSKVKIVRVQVPEDTDLNHYFEIMNTRGEQLEKHEVLKASLLNEYNKIENIEERMQRFAVFNMVWEATSDMNYYMQYRFPTNNKKNEPDIRTELFGEDWNWLEVEDYDELFNILNQEITSHNVDNLTIDEVIASKKTFDPNGDKLEESERFTTVINFPNFLLHVLRIQEQNDTVKLDDKKLLGTFDELLKSKPNKIEFVDDFVFNLFRIRFLFDSYIIKREEANGKENWSLKKLKRYEKSKASYVNTFKESNQTLIMLLSMFHVSTPTMIYKHWLNAALNFLHINYMYNEEIVNENYIYYLETFAKNLLLHRFLAKAPKDYYDLIYKVDELDLKDYRIGYDNPKLTYGNIENNLVFNFLDYILWDREHPNYIDKFEFTFRSSVEHYYPQNPIGGEPLSDKRALHSFGNLCLISHSKNSKLNNHLPSAKRDYFQKSESKLPMDSIKLNVMVYGYNPNNWGVESIKEHNVKMVDEFNVFIKEL
ncbi:DUF262 domain-containing protein [Arenibacter sp. TNZ]|uniref:DUF262 domain-containing protein n=1 Tax=Arenibacter TaxID=178469 RepID=UPI000CD3BE8F|nr:MULTISPECIES: DUF262 domain-containing protein [Arenibacter]MCM4171841.1 DUF262 domain-containing protein [Arenibacter sp. TNZ]